MDLTAIKIEQEDLTESLIAEITPLLERHWAEVAYFKDVPVSVNWPIYQVLAKADLLIILTVRELDKLIGYGVYTLNPNLHYDQISQAQQDVLFVESGKRGAMIGSKLIKMADELLSTMGVHSVYHHVKLTHDFSKLLERQGYEQVEKIFVKRL